MVIDSCTLGILAYGTMKWFLWRQWPPNNSFPMPSCQCPKQTLLNQLYTIGWWTRISIKHSFYWCQRRFLENVEADKGKLNIVREARHFKRTAIMQGEIVSIPNKINDIQQIVSNTTQLCIISNFAEGNQMAWAVIHWVVDSRRNYGTHYWL